MHKRLTIISFFLSIPIILYGLILVLPTFDDWTYITSPYFGDAFSAERLLPWNGYWRPFDALLGSVLGLNYRLFPALNHFLVLLGHVGTTMLVYRISIHLQGETDADNRSLQATVPAAFFFLSPGMLGTVIDIDSVNQTYATFWGMFSLLAYLKGNRWQWLLCVIIATFCKENGIMYAIVPPMIQYAKEGSGKSLKSYIPDIAKSMSFIVVYGILRFLFTNAQNGVADDYLTASFADHVKDLVQYLSFTWLPVDYEAVVFEPTRCIPIAVITLITALPFLLLFAKELWLHRREKLLYGLFAAYIIVALPHLLTLFSAMHTYAGLGIAALIVGVTFRMKNCMCHVAFVLFLLTALFTDLHHWQAAYQSGLEGRQMAMQVIENSKTKPQRVFIIHVDKGETKYSTFNVVPYDAFGWGRAAEFYSGYTMASECQDTTIVCPESEAEKKAIINQIKQSVECTHQFDAIWSVEGNEVTILNK